MSCNDCDGILVPVNATGPQGPQGIPGPPGPVGPAGLTWQGAWNATTSYALNDAVGYSGASYFCIVPIVGNPGNNNPAVDITLPTPNWALLASQGATGSQGLQGMQGLPGNNGVSSYVYIGFAVDTAGTSFNVVQNAGSIERCYINILTSTDPISPLSAASFVVGGTVTYVTGWINLCSNANLVPNSGTFSSGPVDPTSSALAGDIYLNTTSAVFFYYTGAQWDAIPNSYPITNPGTIVPNGLYTASVVPNRAPQFRQVGSTVKTQGAITTASPSLVTTDVVLFSYPTGYTPKNITYCPVFDTYTATWGTVRVDINGDAVLLGTKTPIYVDELSLDTIQFELI